MDFVQGDSRMIADAVEQVRTIASDVFNMLVQEELPGSAPETMDDWDSMQRLNLVLALEEHFDVEFTPEEIEGMKTLSDFAAVVEEKRGQGPERTSGLDRKTW
jgi:acyl carrier protein